MTQRQPPDPTTPQPWYSGITGYQWLVLAIASLGWIFDVFEGQVFVASMNEAMPSLLPPGTPPESIQLYNNVALGAFLAGGALGGVLFGALGDRIGRARTMVLTILMYSLFTCLTAFAQTWWQVAVLRFLVALGVGGEWAVASAMVAEVFPPRARAWSGAIFHGSSVFGTYLAVAAGTWIVANPALGWRWGFAVGALPALLTIWIRWQLREPETWERDRAQRTAAAGNLPAATKQAGRLRDLFAPTIASRTLLGFSLAVIGLATFWGVHIYGKDFLLHRARTRAELLAGLAAEAPASARQAAWQTHQTSIKRAEMWGMFLTTTGGGLGLLAFGPVCEWLGRRMAFVVFHAGGLVMGLVLFQTHYRYSDAALAGLLVLFGFWTLGMHAGYAIYFPELFPTRLRSLGAGFCFNFARFTTAVMLVVSGWLQQSGVSFETSGTALSFLFLAGAAIAWLGPETKGTTLS
ncbi:MAG: MFS transporter [Planctomycetaceae bacterium]|nr:MFS transporter [Planctomycetaceae bacterium]